MRIDRRVALLLAVVALGFALGGCGWFGGKTKEYETSREERPLEVPPDLDAPATSSALTIPDTRPPAAGISASAPSTSVPPGGDVPPTPPAPVASSYTAGEDSTLRVVDAPDGAWKRVGFALERSGVAAVAGGSSVMRCAPDSLTAARAPFTVLSNAASSMTPMPSADGQMSLFVSLTIQSSWLGPQPEPAAMVISDASSGFSAA